jgi:hypothetical protein
MNALNAKLAALPLLALASISLAPQRAGAELLRPHSVEFAMVNDFPLGAYRETISSYNLGWQSRLNLEYEPDRRFGGFVELENAYWTGSPEYIDGGSQIGLATGIKAIFPIGAIGELGILRLGGDLGFGLLAHLAKGSWTGGELGSFFGQAIIADCEASVELARLSLDPFVDFRYLFSPGQASANTHEIGLHIGGRYRLGPKAVPATAARRPAPEPVLAIEFESPEIDIFAGESARVAVRVSSAEADASGIRWATADPAIADVAPGGAIKAKKPGETRVTASAGEGGVEASVRVAVWLSPDLVLAGLEPGFALGESESRVTADIALPTLAGDGLQVLWASEDEGAISPDGKVTRPGYGEGDKLVRLRANAARGGRQAVRDYSILVAQVTKAEAVQATEEGLSIGFAEPDTAESVTSPISLPRKAMGGIEIEWFSSRPDLVTDEGLVTRPSFSAGDAEVILTALVFAGGKSAKKSCKVLVKAWPQSDAEAVRADASVLQIRFAEGDTAEAVGADLELPRSGANGAAISWSSSQPGIISEEGALAPPGGEDARVWLTATLTKGEASATKRFFLTAKARRDDTGAATDEKAER